MAIFANGFIACSLLVQNTASPIAPDLEMNPDHGWLGRMTKSFGQDQLADTIESGLKSI
jgi:hypothetical protein